MAPTFREVAWEWLEKKVPLLSNSKHQHQTATSLEQFISKVGDLVIDKMPVGRANDALDQVLATTSKVKI